MSNQLTIGGTPNKKNIDSLNLTWKDIHFFIQIKQGQKRPLDTVERKIERREREKERESERERHRESESDKIERKRRFLLYSS